MENAVGKPHWNIVAAHLDVTDFPLGVLTDRNAIEEMDLLTCNDMLRVSVGIRSCAAGGSPKHATRLVVTFLNFFHQARSKKVPAARHGLSVEAFLPGD